jgi:hypothetical protein
MKISEKDFEAANTAFTEMWRCAEQTRTDCLRAAIDAIPEPAPVACGDDVREAVARVVFGFALPVFTWEADTAFGHKTWLKRADAVLAVILPRLCPACVEKLSAKAKTPEERVYDILARRDCIPEGTSEEHMRSKAAEIVAALKEAQHDR